MTVAGLKYMMADVPDDHQVLISSDSDGNSFSRLEGWTKGNYDGDEYSDEQEMEAIANNAENSTDEEEFSKQPINCIVLWP